MIVKIQLPLMTTMDHPMALIYNNDRSFQEQIPVTQELKDAMDGDVKAYFRVEIKEGDLHLLERVKGGW